MGPEHPSTLTSMANLASNYWNQGRWDEAEKLDMQVMEASIAVLELEHPGILISMNNLAYTMESQGKLHGALAPMEESYKLRSKVLGPNYLSTHHPLVLLATGLMSIFCNGLVTLVGCQVMCVVCFVDNCGVTSFLPSSCQLFSSIAT